MGGGGGGAGGAGLVTSLFRSGCCRCGGGGEMLEALRELPHLISVSRRLAHLPHYWLSVIDCSCLTLPLPPPHPSELHSQQTHFQTLNVEFAFSTSTPFFSFSSFPPVLKMKSLQPCNCRVQLQLLKFTVTLNSRFFLL